MMRLAVNAAYAVMIAAPSRRPRPWCRQASASTASVKPAYQAVTSNACPDGAPRPTMVPGSSSPAMTFRVLLFSAVLSVAAPRPRPAKYTAATALGRLVTAASTSPPVMISGTPRDPPRLEAARSIVMLARMTTTSAAAAAVASLHRPRRGRMACSSSCSSSATADTSQARHRAGRRKPWPRVPRTATYSASTPPASTRPANGGTAPRTTSAHTTATQTATVPVRATTLRCRPIRPAATAPRPSRAARLKTFEPSTTPAPIRCWWLANAAIAAVTSGASAASAATMPSSASDRPSRSPIRSSRDTSSQLMSRLAAAPAANATTVSTNIPSRNCARAIASRARAPAPARAGISRPAIRSTGSPGRAGSAVGVPDLLGQRDRDQQRPRRRPRARPWPHQEPAVILVVAEHPQLQLGGQARLLDIPGALAVDDAAVGLQPRRMAAQRAVLKPPLLQVQQAGQQLTDVLRDRLR